MNTEEKPSLWGAAFIYLKIKTLIDSPAVQEFNPGWLFLFFLIPASRLQHVREQKIAEKRGGWSAWLREVEISTSQADRFIKVVDELGGKFPTLGSISFNALYEIATLPKAERERQHTVPSSGNAKSYSYR